MAERVFVVGVGMTDFVKPAARPDWDYPDMVREAGTQALADAGVTYEQIEHVAAGYCFGDTTAGQRAVYELGHTGVPVVNVNNACATGSTALMVARNAVAAGMADCALAIGFEKMGRFTPYTDRAYPLDRHLAAMATRHENSDALITAQMFGNAGREHMERYGTRAESFARIAVKNHRHSVHNPRAQFRKEFSLEEVHGLAGALPAAHPAAELPDLEWRGGRGGGQRALRARARAAGRARSRSWRRRWRRTSRARSPAATSR